MTETVPRRHRLRTLASVIPLAAALLLAPPAAAEPSTGPVALAPAAPAGSIMPIGHIDAAATQIYQGWNWANAPTAALYTTASGWIGIVQPDLAHHRVIVTIVNPATRKLVGKRVLPLNAAWTNWGGFYAAPNGMFYLLVGRKNPHETKDLVVVQVQRYTSAWKAAGVANVRAGDYARGIWDPFSAGAADVVQAGDRLVVHMPTEIFAIQGVHHQTDFTFEINAKSLKTTAFGAYGSSSSPYSSHSFQQFVTYSGSQLAFLDHGDAYPRAVQLSVIPDYPASRALKSYSIYKIAGTTGDNYTGVDVTGMVAGPSGILVTGRSVKMASYANRSQPRNAFLMYANPKTGASRLTFLTSVAATGVTVSDPHIVQVDDDRFAVLYDVVTGAKHSLNFSLFNSAGTKLTQKALAGVEFSATDDPVLIGDRLYWVGERTTLGVYEGGGDTVGYVYGLDLTDITSPTLVK